MLQAGTGHNTEEALHSLGRIEYEGRLAVEKGCSLGVDLLGYKTQSVQRTEPVGLQAMHNIILAQQSRAANDSPGRAVGSGTKFHSLVLPGSKSRPQLDGSGLPLLESTAFGGYFTVVFLVKIVHVDSVPDFSW